MMIKQPDSPIVLLESDGERRNFDPVELQDSLVRCFLSAGLRENCYLAEDIALAVEYAFDHSGRPGKVFSRSELDGAVVRILGDTGLADVASLYQRGAQSVLTVDCDTDADTVGAVLRKFMAGTEAHLGYLAAKVSKAASLLQISSAAPSLLVELARHYESAVPLPVVAPAVGKTAWDEYNFVTAEEILPLLSSEARMLAQRGVIRVHGVSRMFPSVRLFCFLSRFAEGEGMAPPVTELTLAPLLFRLGGYLEECRLVTLRLYREVSGNPKAVLPVYMTLPDMTDFTERYLEASHPKSEKLEREVAQMIADALSVKAEKVSMGS